MLTNSICILRIRAINNALLSKLFQKPCASTTGIGKSLKRSKGLGNNNEECCFWIKILGFLAKVNRVNVGDKASSNTSVCKRLQSLVDHNRTKVRATNTNTYNSLDRLARNALPLSRANSVTEGIHLVQSLVNIGDNILSVNNKRAGLSRGTTKRCVENCSILSSINMLAGIHSVSTLFKFDLFCKVTQKVKRLLRGKVFGKINQELIKLKRKILDTLRVFCKPVLQRSFCIF